MRLDKLLAHMGFGSRKQVKEFIRSGNVYVNGSIIKNDDYKVDENNDEVNIFDQKVNYQKDVYIMLNKPEDYISATFDYTKPTVLDLLSEYSSFKIFPIGRLDIDTTGLLILSNDGKLAHQLLAPKSHVSKVYKVNFEGEFKEEYYSRFEKGILLDDGYKTLPSKVELIDSNNAYITIYEGKYHQVKRMFAANNMHVINLERIKFGPLELDTNLKKGEYRLLTNEEINLLKGNENG